jgi:hypothetical protein
MKLMAMAGPPNAERRTPNAEPTSWNGDLVHT